MPPLGLNSGEVRLASYNAAWQRKFATERRRLRRYLSRHRYAIEHIGSTAVPGLDAKPIIDIAIRIPSFRTLPTWIRNLESAGYAYKGEYGLPGRHFFTRGQPVTHHLHLVTPDTPHWDDWLLFRDHLRAHPAASAAYNRVKHMLAQRFKTNRNAYTRAKTAIVSALVKAARRWRSTGTP